MRMDTIATKATLLERIEISLTKRFAHQLSDKLVYHNLSHTQRILQSIQEIGQAESLSDEELEVVTLAGWFVNSGFLHLDKFGKIESPRDLFAYCNQHSIEIARQELQKHQVAPEKIELVTTIIRDGAPLAENPSRLGIILADAVTADWAKPGSKKRLKLLYEEFLLTDVVSFGKSTWYDEVLSYLQTHQYLTEFGQTHYEPKKLELILKIEKDRKELDKKERTLIKKELGISDEELKKLKKSLKSVKGRDERGIQTMFRTTSRNHYTMNQMVDRKANIMISINAILLSLIMSRIIGDIDTFCIHNTPILVLLIGCTVSIVFAIMAITPSKTHGEFTEEEIRNKRGNLLYFGNFHNMNFRDYQWGMLQMLNDHDFLYSSMIQDLYFLGQTLNNKSKLIRGSLSTFMIGVGLAVGMFLVVSSMSDFHLGSATH